ncbi:MAG: hypothetical protein J0L84_02380 [Verrucomicrobia bacterium]|nr:hypothetical protein [Verrucomicrobiota bacterium]
MLCLAALSAARAEFVVDTGPGAAVVGGSQFGNDLRIGGTFTLADPVVVNSVEGWISTINGGQATMWLYEGSPNDNQLVGSVTIDLPPPNTVGAWLLFDVPDWALSAGEYSVAFGGNDPISGAMPLGAPNPLDSTFFWAGGPWTPTDSIRSIGVRVDALVVPEPGPTLLAWSLLGFGAVWVHRRRQRRR